MNLPRASEGCLRPGELKAAIAGFRAVGVHQQVVEHEGQTPTVLLQSARTRMKLGESSRKAGDLRTASEHLDKAVEYVEHVLASGEPTVDVLRTVSWCWLNMGRLHLDERDPTAASECFERAFDVGLVLLGRQRTTPRVVIEIVNSYGEIGGFYRDAGELATAAGYYRKAAGYGQQVLEAGGPSPKAQEAVAWCWLHLGRLLLEQGDPKSASAYFDKAFRLGQETRERPGRTTPRVVREVENSYADVDAFHRDADEAAAVPDYEQKADEDGRRSGARVDGDRRSPDGISTQSGGARIGKARGRPGREAVAAAVLHTGDIEPGTSAADHLVPPRATAPPSAEASKEENRAVDGSQGGSAGYVGAGGVSSGYRGATDAEGYGAAAGGSGGYGGAGGGDYGAASGGSGGGLSPSRYQAVEEPPTRPRLGLLVLVLVLLVLIGLAVSLFFVRGADDGDELRATQPSPTMPTTTATGDTPGGITPSAQSSGATSSTAPGVTTTTPGVTTTRGTGTSGVAPSGGVNTGGGGTAVEDGAGLMPFVGGIAILCALAARLGISRARLKCGA